MERASDWPGLIRLAGEWTQALGDNIEGWLYLGFASEQMMEKAHREVLKLESSTVQGGVGLAKALLFQGKPREALDAARSLRPG